MVNQFLSVVTAAGSIVRELVALWDNRTFDAELIDRDPATDMDVLKIDADWLTEVTLGNSDDLLVGHLAVAIGNPFSLGQTVTSGIVPELGRAGSTTKITKTLSRRTLR